MTRGEEPGREGDWVDGRSPSQAVIETLAEERDTAQKELPPLFEAVDPEALDRLFLDRDPGTVSFSYSGYEITITEAGEIVIERE